MEEIPKGGLNVHAQLSKIITVSSNTSNTLKLEHIVPFQIYDYNINLAICNLFMIPYSWPHSSPIISQTERHLSVPVSAIDAKNP